MEIQVKLYNDFKRYAQANQNVFSMKIEAGASVNQLLADLQIPSSVKRVVLVNGRRVNEGTRLSSGDTVVLFSPVAGG